MQPSIVGRSVLKNAFGWSPMVILSDEVKRTRILDRRSMIKTLIKGGIGFSLMIKFLSNGTDRQVPKSKTFLIDSLDKKLRHPQHRGINILMLEKAAIQKNRL